MNKKQQKKIRGQRIRRIRRVRSRLSGTAARPRLAVHRSLRNMSAQLIDDEAGKTLLSAHQRELGKKKLASTEAAKALGTLMAQKAQKAGIKSVVFDRRHYKYHGRVKSFADAVREAGIKI